MRSPKRRPAALPDRSRHARRASAIDWLQRAARLQSDNYWYQFLLAYLEDKAGFVDDALDHYSVAVALKPESPGVRFSRARLYRSKGRWDWARDDLESVLEKLSGRPEAPQVHLELGYLYQELGNFAGARSEYDQVIAGDHVGTYAKAARLNLEALTTALAEQQAARAKEQILLNARRDQLEARLRTAERAEALAQRREAELDELEARLFQEVEGQRRQLDEREAKLAELQDVVEALQDELSRIFEEGPLAGRRGAPRFR